MQDKRVKGEKRREDRRRKEAAKKDGCTRNSESASKLAF
jgi:hypothetical protein